MARTTLAWLPACVVRVCPRRRGINSSFATAVLVRLNPMEHCKPCRAPRDKLVSAAGTVVADQGLAPGPPSKEFDSSCAKAGFGDVGVVDGGVAGVAFAADHRHGFPGAADTVINHGADPVITKPV
jgi:hypothetical protein